MAIELYCSDNSSMTMSPRYSFSHDLSQTDNILPIENRRPSLDYSLSSAIDFDFNVRESSLDHQDSSSADELFSDGMIRSVQIKKKMVKSKQVKNNHMSQSNKSKPHAPPPLPPPNAIIDHDLKTMSSLEAEEEQNKQNSKSFWRFKRSSSLNCGSGYGRSLCPLPLLSRSNSTGSAPSVSKKNQKPNNSQKHPSSFVPIKSTQTSSSSSTSNYQKPPLKKSNYGSYGSSSNGVHINPVLHVSSASLFGFGSIFSNGKVKNKNR